LRVRNHSWLLLAETELTVVMSNKFYRDLVAYGLAMLLGLAAIAGPAVILGLGQSSHPYYPALINGIGHYSWLSFFFQISAGSILGWFSPRRSWRWGLAMMVPFPVLTFIDVAHGWESHQLWPLEFVFHAILSLPCIGGAVFGAYIARKKLRGADKANSESSNQHPRS